MVRHTLKSLGPKVLSTRMVREYVDRLYTPAAVASRSMNDSYEGAADLAAWKARVVARLVRACTSTTSRPRASPTAPELGGGMDLHVFVSLGSLAPEDVDVQVVHGRVKGEDELVDTTTTPLTLAETYEGGRHRFDGHLQLSRAGSFGYTVRILPAQPAPRLARGAGVGGARVGGLGFPGRPGKLWAGGQCFTRQPQDSAASPVRFVRRMTCSAMARFTIQPSHWPTGMLALTAACTSPPRGWPRPGGECGRWGAALTSPRERVDRLAT